MALHELLRQTDTVLKHERQDRYDQGVEEQVCEEGDSDCGDDEEGIASPFQPSRFDGVVGLDLEGI